jgi:hypothetical protein
VFERSGGDAFVTAVGDELADDLTLVAVRSLRT